MWIFLFIFLNFSDKLASMLHQVIKKRNIFQTADNFFENSSICHILRYWITTDEVMSLFLFIAIVISWSGLILFSHWMDNHFYNLYPYTHVYRAKLGHTFNLKSYLTNRMVFSCSWSFVNLEVKWKEWLSVIANRVLKTNRC